MSARRPLPALALLLVTVASPVGCTTTAPRSPDDAAAELRELESRRAGAMLNVDVATLERLFAAELRYGHANGVVEDGTALLERLRSGALRYERIEPRDLDVRLAGDAALVRGVAAVRAVGPAGTVDATLSYLAVYVFRDRRWQLVAYQSAPR